MKFIKRMIGKPIERFYVLIDERVERQLASGSKELSVSVSSVDFSCLGSSLEGYTDLAIHPIRERGLDVMGVTGDATGTSNYISVMVPQIPDDFDGRHAALIAAL